MAWSASTIETTHSTIGGALGTTQGSCLPGTFRSISEPVETSSVFCVLAIDAVGLNPIRILIGIPLDNPPKISTGIISLS